MSETLEEKVARLERELDHAKELAERSDRTLFGEDNQSGLTREFRDLKTENRYLRILYVMGTALILPWVNALLGKLGLGTLKIGP